MNGLTFPEFSDPYWPLLAQAKRPSRYSGSEYYSGRGGGTESGNADDNAHALSFCLAFPDVYEIGMSYYGFQLLEALLNGIPGVKADRAYCPWTDMEELLRASSLPLVSVRDKIPLGGFGVIGFTLQHELSYTNILTMLDLSGIPFRAADRDARHPVIIGGGPGAFVPGVVAPFFDILCIGDGEEMLPELCSRLIETRGSPRDERLRACADIPGVYVPAVSAGARLRRVYSAVMPPIPEELTVPAVSIVHDRAAVELFRGCSRGCRFCQAGMVTRPVRERSPEEVTEGIKRLVARTGWEEAGLLSLASCDFTGIEQVLKSLSHGAKGFKVSLPSLRMDAFSVGLAAGMEGLKRGSLTFAPEAGTQRLRDVINKGISDADIESSLASAFSNGWDRIKLYFMMGLPTETEADLAGITETAARALRIARERKNNRAQISVSVAGFVPKAHTPFQWERQNSIDELREKGRLIKGRNKSRRVTLNYHNPEQSFLEGVFARGDARLADAIELAWRDGARFDNWTETFSLERWNRAFEKAGIDTARYTGERALTDEFCWDVIDMGVTREYLLRERERALSGAPDALTGSAGADGDGAKTTPDCRTECAACGIQNFASGCTLRGSR